MLGSEWIKMRVNLSRDPAVVSIARRLKMDPRDVVGRLHEVWSWYDQHTTDGSGRGIDADFIDDLAGKRGFAQAMASTPLVPWLVIDAEGVHLPRFERHNGASAKRRAMEADRKQRGREADERPQPVREMSASDADTPRTESGRDADQKEKENKNKTETPLTPLSEGPGLRPAGADSDAPGKSPRKSPRKRAAPDSNVPRLPDGRAASVAFRDAWGVLFREHKGAEYGFGGARDGQHVEAIMALAGLRRDPPSDAAAAEAAVALAIERARALLTSPDPFYAEKGVDLGTLRSQWNRLASAGRGVVRDLRVGQAPVGDFSEAAAAGGVRRVAL